MQSIHQRFIFLALVVSIVLSLCSINNLIPMAEAATHSEAAFDGCMPDTCAKRETKKSLSQEKPIEAKLLLTPAALSFVDSFQTRIARPAPPNDRAAHPVLNKLYRLHATYLI